MRYGMVRSNISMSLVFVLNRHFDLNLDKTLYMFIAGRYEFSNKGADMYIECMSRLNHRLKVWCSVYFVLTHVVALYHNLSAVKLQKLWTRVKLTIVATFSQHNLCSVNCNEKHFASWLALLFAHVVRTAPKSTWRNTRRHSPVLPLLSRSVDDQQWRHRGSIPNFSSCD